MRVLVVDDVEDIREMYQRLLRFMGHEVFCVHDGQQALEDAKRWLPDVVLLDICMPGMDGWAVAEHLRADPATRHIPLVAISSLDGPYEQQLSKQAGFSAHFQKPLLAKSWSEILNIAAAAPTARPAVQVAGDRYGRYAPSGNL